MDVSARRILACGCILLLFSCVAFADDQECPYRFAYRWGNHRVAFELSETYEGLTDLYWPVIEQLEKQTPRGKLIVLPAPILDKVKTGIRERIGDTFPMYVPQLAKSVSLRLVTLTPRYCGDGYCGVFGVGETEETLPKLPTREEAKSAEVTACGVVLIDRTPEDLPKDWGSEYVRSLAGRGLGSSKSASFDLRTGRRTLEVTLSKPPLEELKAAYGDRLDMVEPGDRCSVEIRDTSSGEIIAFEDPGSFYVTPRGGIYGVGGLESCAYYDCLRVWILPRITGEEDQKLLITAGATSEILEPRMVNEGGTVVTRMTMLHANIISP